MRVTAKLLEHEVHDARLARFFDKSTWQLVVNRKQFEHI
jgi:hypothetical protein